MGAWVRGARDLECKWRRVLCANVAYMCNGENGASRVALNGGVFFFFSVGTANGNGCVPTLYAVCDINYVRTLQLTVLERFTPDQASFWVLVRHC